MSTRGCLENIRNRQGKVIGVRWVDVNKGDSIHKDYRSRLVGKEFRSGIDHSLYAATPPLESLRAIISYAATFDREEKCGRKGMVDSRLVVTEFLL